MSPLKTSDHNTITAIVNNSNLSEFKINEMSLEKERPATGEFANHIQTNKQSVTMEHDDQLEDSLRIKPPKEKTIKPVAQSVQNLPKDCNPVTYVNPSTQESLPAKKVPPTKEVELPTVPEKSGCCAGCSIF